jgi:hypothetical protein
MTIKQQGGIFGRNPDFNDVSANSVSSKSLSASNSTGSTLTLKRDDTGISGGDLVGAIIFENNDASGSAPHQFGIIGKADDAFGDGSLWFYTARDGYETSATPAAYVGGKGADLNSWGFGTISPTEKVHVVGNIKAEAGNIIVDSGKGIDFSATSGTGTSELFSDYEEGSWSPTLNAYAGTPTVSGYYVKIGQMVYVECSIALDGTSDASNYIITGLPFTMASPYLGGGAVNTNDGGVADALVGSDASGRLRLRNSSGSNQTYNSIGVSSTVTLNAQYRAA